MDTVPKEGGETGGVAGATSQDPGLPGPCVR